MQEQHQQIMHAVFTLKQTLREYGEANGLTYEQTEQLLSEALRKQKKQTRWGNVAHHIADGTHHILRQGSRFPGLARDTTRSEDES